MELEDGRLILSEINKHCQRAHELRLICDEAAGKGRILKAGNTSFSRGSVILREKLLHTIKRQPGNKAYDEVCRICAGNASVFCQDPVWYWAGLCSLTQDQAGPSKFMLPTISADQQQRILLLHTRQLLQPSEAACAIVDGFGLALSSTALELEKLMQAWYFNCYAGDGGALDMYFTPSFMNHSCLPKAVWHIDGNEYVLLALRDIAAGEELTISYLSTVMLAQSTGVRMKALRESKEFNCKCERCNCVGRNARKCRARQCDRHHVATLMGELESLLPKSAALAK